MCIIGECPRTPWGTPRARGPCRFRAAAQALLGLAYPNYREAREAVIEVAETMLGDCLVDYFQARSAALTAARLHVGLGELDARALVYVADHPGIRPSILREQLGVTSAAVSNVVDRLVVRGALRRDPDPDDRRANRVSATVDLDAPPWDELRRFDRQVAAAASRLSAVVSRAALEAVDAVVDATRQRGSSGSSRR